jgi:hypothetical protein
MEVPMIFMATVQGKVHSSMSVVRAESVRRTNRPPLPSRHVMALRPDLIAVVESLALEYEARGSVPLDALGEAIGTRAISAPEIEAMLDALERRGLAVAGPEGGGLLQTLEAVLSTARLLVGDLGRRPTSKEVALRAGMSVDEVRAALRLGSVLGR